MENFENLNHKINSINKEQVDSTVEQYFSNEGQAGIIKRNDLESESLEIDIDKYDNMYLLLSTMKNNLKEAQKKFEPGSEKFLEKEAEIGRVVAAMCNIMEIIESKENKMKENDQKIKDLIKNN